MVLARSYVEAYRGERETPEGMLVEFCVEDDRPLDPVHSSLRQGKIEEAIARAEAVIDREADVERKAKYCLAVGGAQVRVRAPRPRSCRDALGGGLQVLCEP